MKFLVGVDKTESVESMADETRHVWLVVLDGQDVQVNHVGTGSVEVPLSCSVAQFKKAVVAMYVRLLNDVQLDQLHVYPSMDEFLNHDCALLDDQSIAEFGSTPAQSIVVLAPDLQHQRNEDFPTKKRQRCDASANPKLSNLLVDPAEFNLANLSAIQSSKTPIVSTLGLQAFSQGYGGFPSSYMVRREESLVWQVIEDLLDGRNPTRVVLVGSSGVGKSCLVMRIGMYMAFFKQKQVVIVRKLMIPGLCNAVIYLDGRSKRVWKEMNVLDAAMAELINGRFRDALLFVDGYSQAELAESHHQALRPFHFLATSCYYDVKPSDFAEMVVLPAWHRSDLLTYARLTKWAVDSGLASEETLSEVNLKDLVDQQYFYSGGSLHQFCKTRPQLIRRVDLDCQVVGNVGGAIDCSPFYGYKDSRTNENLDRVCRHYVADASDPLHYTRWSQWKFCIDSGYALTNLGQELTSKELFQVYQYGKSIDAGFQAAAFKLFFHRAIYECRTKGFLPQINMRTNSPYPHVHPRVVHTLCQGRNESECLDYLAQSLDAGIYWHPENATFPFADAVAFLVAYATAKSGQRREVYFMAVISVITEDDEGCQHNQLDKVSQALKSNTKLKDYKHVSLVVRPKTLAAESGIPRCAPQWTPFAAMEASFE